MAKKIVFSLAREGEEETIDYFCLLFIHAALLSHVKKSVNECKLCDPFAKLIQWHQKGPKRENQMAQIKKMLSCMIVLSESLFFGEEMSHRVSTKTSRNSWGVFISYPY